MALHVLVVSPDAARRGALTGAMAAAGHRAAGVASGPEAAAALTETGLDAVVIDLLAPELDGAALRALLDPAAPAGPDSLEDAERRHIAHVLHHTGGNKRQAALILGISRSTLLHKVRKYRIVTPRS
jgi:DNA-binding NtrC family response regulator